LQTATVTVAAASKGYRVATGVHVRCRFAVHPFPDRRGPVGDSTIAGRSDMAFSNQITQAINSTASGPHGTCQSYASVVYLTIPRISSNTRRRVVEGASLCRLGSSLLAYTGRIFVPTGSSLCAYITGCIFVPTGSSLRAYITGCIFACGLIVARLHTGCVFVSSGSSLRQYGC